MNWYRLVKLSEREKTNDFDAVMFEVEMRKRAGTELLVYRTKRELLNATSGERCLNASNYADHISCKKGATKTT